MSVDLRYEYDFPLSVMNLLLSSVHLKNFIESMIDDVVKLNNENAHKADYIPPIVYSAMGRAFNVDYNFLVKSLAYFGENESIEYDFVLKEGMSTDRYKLAHFLVVSVLEDYYELVRLNNNQLDVSKYRNARSVSIAKRFHNVVCIQRGENIRRFRAVPFSEMNLKKLIDISSFEALDKVANRNEFVQVVFGEHKYKEYLQANRIEEIPYVTEKY
jgi:hypothetical protein